MTILIDYGRVGMREQDGERDDDGDEPGTWPSPTGTWPSSAEAAFRKRVLDLIARIEEKVDRMLEDQDGQE